MSPLQINILLHYHAIAVDFPNMHEAAVRKEINNFKDRDGMLESVDGDKRTYQLTDRGKVFVNHICGLPLPECQWRMPDAT